MKYIIGIDIGTGSTKAVALDLKYQPITTSQAFYPTSVPLPGYSEQIPELIWQAFLQVINELTDKLGGDVIGIGLSSAMHSLLVTDDDGNPLSTVITWADGRSSEEAKHLKSLEKGLHIYKATGTPIHPMSPLCKLIWMHRNEPALFAKADKFISIKEYIWFKLFGEYKIDYSIASCTGLFDIHEKIWNKQALALSEISNLKLSEPVQTSYANDKLLSEASKLLKGLKTSFVIGASDGCLANLGSEATTDGVAALTIGTSGAIRLASSRPILNSSAMTFNYILDAETYICGGPVNNGGIALQWLMKNIFDKKNLLPEDYEAIFEQVALTPAGSVGLIFLPYLAGERAPIWDSEASGTFFGLNLGHSQNHLARAVIEGICYALNDVLKALEQQSNSIRQINVSGGFVHSKIWMQILADITGKKLVLVLQEDASAVGAAYLAAKSLKIVSDYPVSSNLEPEVILPNHDNHLHYQKTFLIFKQLYADLSTSMHQLHHLKF